MNVTYTYPTGEPIIVNDPEDAGNRTLLVYAFAAAALTLALAAAVAYAYLRRRRVLERRKLMQTLSGNEYMVVDMLFEKGGGIKRNDLERASGMAKSSLAAVINNLERKKIIEVNRTNNVHYVELVKSWRRL
ncbi:MAG: hypothetical protein NTU61_04590 [Candidatus Altiarchaeota archaeon]|nr:hypothetical protein [Candidatus Altiarchaeota archaeon]